MVHTEWKKAVLLEDMVSFVAVETVFTCIPDICNLLTPGINVPSFTTKYACII